MLRRLLFHLDPEQAHHLTLILLKLAGDFPVSYHLLSKMYQVEDPRLEVEAFGIRFKNPIGLAGGYDKDGIAVKGLGTLGFGHVEVGTVTRHPQYGNPRPRIVRVPEVEGLVNSMGFPSAGVDALKIKRGGTVRVGINLGKGKNTPLEQAAQEYVESLRCVYTQADYVSLNVSSPNTLGLRKMQARDAVRELLHSATTARDSLTPWVPVLVKISPDLTESEIDDILAAVIECGVDGVVATNTTVDFSGAPGYSNIPGGLSGPPLRARATQVVRYIAQQTRGKLPIVGVGGIASAADALEKLRAGAQLIQVYTGLVYAGPGLVRQINLGLLKACVAAGVNSVGDLSSGS